jgi:hypothetical protein
VFVDSDRIFFLINLEYATMRETGENASTTSNHRSRKTNGCSTSKMDVCVLQHTPHRDLRGGPHPTTSSRRTGRLRDQLSRIVLRMSPSENATRGGRTSACSNTEKKGTPLSFVLEVRRGGVSLLYPQVRGVHAATSPHDRRERRGTTTVHPPSSAIRPSARAHSIICGRRRNSLRRRRSASDMIGIRRSIALVPPL